MSDRLDMLNKQLKELIKKIEIMNKKGLDEEILIIYLAHKTKLSKRKVKLLLDNVDAFYNKIVTRLIGDEL